MLCDVKNDLRHLLSILQSIGKIGHYTKSITSAEEFIDFEDQVVYNACLTLMANIGEQFNKLSDKTTERFNSDILKGAIGVRNRISHDYTGVNSFIIWDVIQGSLKNLKIDIEITILKYLKDEVFDIEEYYVAKDSSFYKFVDFDSLK